MEDTQCVGFADCPCKRCRALRVRYTAEHPNHGHIQDRSYCGVCKTEARNR